MELNLETDALSALGHPSRLAVFRLVARRAPHGVRPTEISEATGIRPNTLSAHLAELTRAGLLTRRRDGRSILYALDLSRTAALVDFLVNDCCRGRPELCHPLVAHALKRLAPGEDPLSDRPFEALFICTGNSARSIFAEAILAKEGAGRFRAHSAGTRPYSRLNPHALAVLRDLGHDVSGLRAKHVSEFQGSDAPSLDFVFTVCDHAANEECPPWPGQPITAHWGVADPVKVEGSDAEKGLAFFAAYRAMHRRLTGFLALPVESLDRISLQKALDDLGRDAPAETAWAS